MGLVMVGAEVAVTVTREEQHQAALSRYRPGATVAVELGWCVIRSGKYRGERAIEVRLDGQRVGELTYLMSQRYGQLVSRITAGGGRPGGEAEIHSGARGLEITLRLPQDPNAISREPDTVVMAPVAYPAPPSVTKRPKFLTSKPFLIAAAVFLLIVFLGVIGSGDEEPSAGPAADTTTPTTTTTTPPPTTTTTPPPPKPKPVPKPKPKPKPAPPKVTTEEPAPAPPPPPPAPEPDCDPNYSGCVPIASDVDCAGGSGNGPAYVDGPVQVIGNDIYGLDSNNDGVGCED